MHRLLGNVKESDPLSWKKKVDVNFKNKHVSDFFIIFVFASAPRGFCVVEFWETFFDNYKSEAIDTENHAYAKPDQGKVGPRVAFRTLTVAFRGTDLTCTHPFPRICSI